MTDDRTTGTEPTPPPAVSPPPPPPPAGGGTSAANLMNFARGAKGLALLCFLLPWVTVSCAGQPLARITGVQLATGNIDPIGGGAGMPGAPAAPTAQSYSVDVFALGAAILIIAGLVVTFVLARRRAALIGMITAAVAAVLIVFDVFVRIKGAAEDQIRQSGAGGGTTTGPGAEFERQMQQQMEQMTQSISVDPALGFWLTLIALIAAIVLLKMVHGRRTEP